MPEWLRPFLDATRPESPKALVLWQSAAVLALIAFGLGLAVILRASLGLPLDSGTVTAFIGVCGMVAGLAGFHRQADPKGGPDA